MSKMTSPAGPRAPRPLVKRLELLALPLLLGVAVYLWTAPSRAERALERASLPELEAAAQRDPDNPRIPYYQGRRLEQEGREADARAAFKRAAERDGEFEAAWLAWAAAAGRAGSDKEAFAVLDTFVKAHPSGLRAQRAFAYACQQTGQHLRAYAAAKALTQQDARDAEAWRIQGEAALALGHWSEAVEALSRTSGAAASANATPLLLDAAQKMQRHDPAAADAFRAALRSDPQSVVALQGLGLALNLQGKTQEAFGALAMALQRDPGLPEAKFALAGLYYRMGLADEATRWLQKATQDAPDNAVYWNALGMTYKTNMAKYAEAEAALRRALALQPRNVVYLSDLADMLVKAHKTAEAETLYRQALALAPENKETQFALGHLLLEAQPDPMRLAESERLLKQVITADPSYAGAFFDLGRLALKRNDPRQAVASLQRAAALAPGNAATYYQLSLIYARQGDRKRADAAKAAFAARNNVGLAYTDIETQIISHKRDSALRLKLARALAKDGLYAKALNQYEVARSLAPQNAALRREYSELVAGLKAQGQMPDMRLFNAMVSASIKTH